MTERIGAGAPGIPLSYPEFIALMALLMSLTAMSIDIMLPALPDIGATLGVGSPSDLPLVVSFFMFGAAVGQLVWGPLADRFGRRWPLLAGVALFIAATITALISQSFAQLLAARVLQGVGGSVGRIVVTAIVRDLFAGRDMARVISTVTMVFILVPILAPSAGQIVLLVGTWRWIFMLLLVASAVAMVWVALRLPETRPAQGAPRHTMRQAIRLVITNRVTLGYGIAQGFVFALLVAYIASAQQVFGGAYGLGRLFPLAFGSVALAIAAAAFTNSRLVQRLGMRRLSHTALAMFLALSCGLALLAAWTGLALWAALGGMMACLYLYGLMLSNFNAIAMHPMGAAAGMAASLTGSLSMLTGALLGTLIARQFDGTVLPLFAGFAALALGALLTIIVVEGPGGLFRGE
jgi:DHA1 family bicyclomycin/chloramphenicol resistance-like MFS transporter